MKIENKRLFFVSLTLIILVAFLPVVLVLLGINIPELFLIILVPIQAILGLILGSVMGSCIEIC
jgi:hypothetical protein